MKKPREAPTSQDVFAVFADCDPEKMMQLSSWGSLSLLG
jgi:hypothetical protein